MDGIRQIMENNRRWVAEMEATDPDFFRKRAGAQTPRYLFIGCSDSRVPAERLTGAQPGEMFIHRNIANQVFPSDLNLLSVLQYAVEVLDVQDIIVCGHYGCGGVRAAMGTHQHGLVDYWLANIRNVIRWNDAELRAAGDEDARFQRLVELNVIEQVFQLSRTPIVLDAWARGRRPSIHGLVYDLRNGVLRDLVSEVNSPDGAEKLLGVHPGTPSGPHRAPAEARAAARPAR